MSLNWIVNFIKKGALKKVIVIGSGFAGLSAACFLAQKGLKVTVLEKNEQAGGRARLLREQGFSFDMGPSWYWMPDVFERFFGRFGHRVSDYYQLIRLDPSYQVMWSDEVVPIPASFDALQALFEHYEPGAGQRLAAFMEEAAFKYDTAMNRLVYQPGLSVGEYLHGNVLRSFFRMDLLRSMHRHLRRYFRHPRLLQLTEFPVLFLGALPQNTPALYSLMNYADMKLGTWYPMGGMHRIVEGMQQLAESLGVSFRFGEPAVRLLHRGRTLHAVETTAAAYEAAAVVAACDYHHTESVLLQPELRNYDERYWQSRRLAPSCLLYYLGFSKKINGLQHHNLFFDAPFEAHADALYTRPRWPEDPLMYVCVPSKTDPGVAPQGAENVFVLIPVAPGLEDTEALRAQYLDRALKKLEHRSGQALRAHLVYSRSYAGSNFMEDYNAFKGNAYGLSNTLRQTAFLKPSLRNKKLDNLFYTGQLTVPGPGVPPALISGEIAAMQVLRRLQPSLSTV